MKMNIENKKFNFSKLQTTYNITNKMMGPGKLITDKTPTMSKQKTFEEQQQYNFITPTAIQEKQIDINQHNLKSNKRNSISPFKLFNTDTIDTSKNQMIQNDDSNSLSNFSNNNCIFQYDQSIQQQILDQKQITKEQILNQAQQLHNQNDQNNRNRFAMDFSYIRQQSITMVQRFSQFVKSAAISQNNQTGSHSFETFLSEDLNEETQYIDKQQQQDQPIIQESLEQSNQLQKPRLSIFNQMKEKIYDIQRDFQQMMSPNQQNKQQIHKLNTISYEEKSPSTADSIQYLQSKTNSYLTHHFGSFDITPQECPKEEDSQENNKKRQQSYTDNFTTISQLKRSKKVNNQSLDIQEYFHLLTLFEQKEIKKYKEIYFVGTQKAKDRRNTQSILGRNNMGFDQEGGYYKIVEGDHIAYRYEVLQEKDKGAFGQVVRCYDHKNQTDVAIKLNRNSKFDHTSSKSEIEILKLISNQKQNQQLKKSVVQYIDSFLFRNHYCIVFELLGSNLYQDIKQLQAQKQQIQNFEPDMEHLKLITYQILESLDQIKKLGIVHCDLKPENIIYTDSRKKEIKLIDFGSACMVNQQGYSYVQSRFYRAPEVILNVNNPPLFPKYSTPIDIWSLGCIVAELYSGVPVFPGIDENEMLELMVLLLGTVPNEMIESGKKKDRLFYQSNGYKVKRSQRSRVNNLGKSNVKLEHIIFRQNGDNINLNYDQMQMLDFVQKCLMYDPKERISCEEAFKHPFLHSIQQRIQIEKDILQLQNKNDNLFPNINENIVFEVTQEQEYEDFESNNINRQQKQVISNQKQVQSRKYVQKKRSQLQVFNDKQKGNQNNNNKPSNKSSKNNLMIYKKQSDLNTNANTSGVQSSCKIN